MARDDLGVRVEKIATKKVLDGMPTVEKNEVGWANRTLQLGARVDPADEVAVKQIQVGEGFVMMIGGAHEVPIGGAETNAPAGTVEGDRLWIDPATNKLKKEATKGFLPLGVVDEVDTVRGVALVNTNNLAAFLPAP